MPNTNETIRPTRLPWVQGNMLTLALPLTIVHLGDTPTTEDYEPQQGDTISVFLKGLMHCKEYTPTVDGNVLYITDNGELEVDSYSVEVVITEASSPNAKRRSRWNYIVDVYDSNEKVVDFFDDFPDWGQGAILQGSIFYGTGGGVGGVQSDWNETDDTSMAYIKNKPNLPVSGATNGHFAGLDSNGNLTDSGKKAGDFATSTHTHGNITNAGALQTTDITIANGDKLVVTDASNSNKVARTNVAFDGSTTTQALTKKGTFESFPEEVFIATYGTTTATEIATALSAGKLVVAKYDNVFCNLYVVATNYYGFLCAKIESTTRVHISRNDSSWSAGTTGLETTGNKTSDISTNATSTTKYPTTKGVADYVERELSDIEDALDMILGGDTLSEEKKLTIVAASGTTLTASVDNYYLFSSDVGTLAITLTTPSDTTHITKAVFMLTTGSSPAVTFAGASGINVIAQDGFSIEASTTYEINAIYNGVAWVVAAMKLSSTPINS